LELFTGGVAFLQSWNVSENLVVIETGDGKEVGRKNYKLAGRRTYQRVREISDLGIDVLICGAISFLLETALVGKKIQVVAFVCGDMEDILNAFLAGCLNLERFGMPGIKIRLKTED